MKNGSIVAAAPISPLRSCFRGYFCDLNMIEVNDCRGFQALEFEDEYQQKCRLSQSSIWLDDNAPGASCVWLGVDSVEAKILARVAPKYGLETSRSTGWIDYPIPEDVLLSHRMHLNREQVAQLIEKLQFWLDTGTLHGEKDSVNS